LARPGRLRSRDFLEEGVITSEEKIRPELRRAAPRDAATTYAAGLLAWVWPGLGHLFLRRLAKGLVLTGCILALFVLGVRMDSRLVMNAGLEDPLAFLFSVAQMGIGAPYVIARYLGYGFDEALVKSPFYEYGNTFTAVAGLLNVLVILDALDTARGVKR
jgi:hypothetical protein